jgi:hypothetical protein
MTSRVENYDEGLGPPDVYQRRDRDEVWIDIKGGGAYRNDHPLNNARGLGLRGSNRRGGIQRNGPR